MIQKSSLIYQCLKSACAFRFPGSAVETDVLYCPKCGSPVEKVAWHAPDQLDQRLSDAAQTIEVLLDNIRSAYNVGSIFRTSDGAGVRHIHLCGITPPPTHAGVAKTALGAEQTVPWSQDWNATVVAAKLKQKGYQIICLEGGVGSTDLFSRLDGISDAPILLVLGNENDGIDPAIREMADALVNLPMLGRKESLNVAVAYGIAIYTLRFRA